MFQSTVSIFIRYSALLLFDILAETISGENGIKFREKIHFFSFLTVSINKLVWEANFTKMNIVRSLFALVRKLRINLG